MFSQQRVEAAAKRTKQQNETSRVDVQTLRPGDALNYPKRGDSCSVHYTCALENGEIFDSSYSRGQTLLFRLGASQVILGLEEVILKMSKGQKCRAKIPYDLAYGEHGFPPTVPPKSDLVFEVELISFSNESAIITLLGES